jgi:hypothetical protein
VLSSGAVTSITPEPGSGITSNQTAGDVVLSTDPSILQTRISSTCPSGSAIKGINSDGSVNCEPTGTGTITGVTAGTGLTGGGTSGNVTLNVDLGTGTNQAARGDHTHDGLYQQKYGKAAVVAKSGGDYTAPVAAMADITTWCGTPSATNPCLLKIMPGVYDIGANSLQMQPYVDIEGSGENVTVISAAVTDTNWPPNIAAVIGANNAELRFITINNYGSGTIVIAVLSNAVSPKITNVTANASGGATSVGIGNFSSATTIIRNSYASASGPSIENYAVINRLASPMMMNVTAIAAGGTIWNCGVGNLGAATSMTNITAMASGAGATNYGVANAFDPSPTMTNVTASAADGQSNSGIYNGNNDTRTTFVTMQNITATATGGVNNSGISEDQTSSRLMNVIAAASGGSGMHIGILCQSATPNLVNVTARGTGGTNGYGLAGWGLTGPYSITADNSTFEGSTNSISASDQFTIRIGSSKIVGPVDNLGTTNCINVYDGATYTALDAACH